MHVPCGDCGEGRYSHACDMWRLLCGGETQSHVETVVGNGRYSHMWRLLWAGTN